MSTNLDDLFARLSGGDTSVTEELFARVHDELHALARTEMAAQHASHTLQATALVNEAFLKLQGNGTRGLANRAHFLRLAGKAMRQILVDHARKKGALRRAKPGRRLELDELVTEFDRRSGGLVDLEQALKRLQIKDPELVQLIELRFFAGRSMAEVAEILGLSERTAIRRWHVARHFLKGELSR